mmetsp:Transcript_38188/g.83223  ORF Transcript_38188/g.83223 Transcript_38188/m.83223 type:complete len:545 (+) Transcript_38188:614-2248(+)
MPVQEAEQALHSFHWLKMQSRGSSQWMSTAQNFVSRSLPSGSLPHSLAIFAILRFRNMVPPAQVTEHDDHCSQSPQAPSVHFWEQSPRLHGSTISFSNAWQGTPPAVATVSISRFRERMPPSQWALQWLHSFHWPHSQSRGGQSGFSPHSFVCPSSKKQPAPPALRKVTTSRWRDCMLGPQVFEHALHSPQPETRQSRTSQGMTLQPLVSMRSGGHSLPPVLGYRSIWRCRCVCPSPQVLSHSSQCVQSETMQSTGSLMQLCVSDRGPMQGMPPPWAGSLKERLRLRCDLGLQGPHASHGENSQSCGTGGGQPSPWQAWISERLPSHIWPPPVAMLAMSRSRCLVPSPQLWLQAPHSAQSSKSQGAESTTLQATVSLRGPLQAMPPFIGICMILLARYLWPRVPESQALQTDHSESTQSSGALHEVGHVFVASRAPLHGSPSALFMTLMVRWRSHRPRQLGAFQSLQSLNSQLTAVSFPLHCWTKGHSATFSCLPEHLLLLTPLKKKASAFALGRRSIVRLCMAVCWPQVAPQLSDSDHSLQVQ